MGETRRYTVTGPDGRKYTVEAPQGATQAQVLARVQQHAKVAARPSTASAKGGAGWGSNFLEGFLPGTSQFMGGVFRAIDDGGKAALDDKVDWHPLDSYNKGHAETKRANEAFARRNPNTAGTAQVAGFGAGFLLPTKKVAEGASLAQKAKAASQTAGLYGLLSGAMSSEGETLQDKGTDAVSTGLVGAGTGFSLPYALKGLGKAAAPFVKPWADPLTRKTGEVMQSLAKITPPWIGQRRLASEGAQLARDPAQAVAHRQLDKVIAETPHPVTGKLMQPEEVVQEVRSRQAAGVPAVAADLGDAMRDRFGKAARASGPALASVRRQIDARQQANAARAEQHIADTLGPVADIHGQAELLNEQARAAAAPLYALSDAHPVPASSELQELFSRPTGRQAIDSALKSVQDEGISPVMDGVVQRADGSWEAAQVPTMRLYDHAKSALDEVAFAGQSPFAPAAARRDMVGANSIRKRLLELLDGDGSTEGLNPHWKPAREAYAGPVQNRKALELGGEMTKAGAGDISQRLGTMTDGQQEFFRLGHRSALVDDLQSLPDYGDAAKRLAGTPERRGALEAVHGPQAGEALQDRLAAEQDASRTWEEVRGVSSGQMPDIAAQEQHIADAGRGLLQTLAGHPGQGLTTIASALARGQRGGNRIDERIGEILSAQDPYKLNEGIQAILRERARAAQVEQRSFKATAGTARLFGSLLGTNLTDPYDGPPAD